MKYELVELEQYIHDRLPPEILPVDEKLREKVAVHSHYLSLQVQRLRTIFKEDLAAMKDLERARIYVPVHALSILDICGQLANWFQAAKEKGQNQLMEFYSRIDRLLSDLLQILQKTLPAAFDTSLPIPFTIYNDHLPHIRQLIDGISDLKPLLDHHNQPVIDLVQTEITSIWASPREVTYHLLEYTTRLLTALSEIKDRTVPNYSHYLHTAVLIRLNYNSPKYIERCIFKLIEKMDEMNNLEKLITIDFYVDELSKIVPLKSDCLISDEHSALDQLKAWTFQEKKKLEKPLLATQQQKELEKLFLDLSVDELAALTYGAQKAGFTRKDDKLNLFRQIIAFIRTIGTDNIAIDSFANKTYKPKEAAKVSMRAKLRLLDDALR
ncbi:hypothetical protein [Chitinophaga arvensicola]|uniref:Uncharacterized protein n=1 Tax=Chitinophaga arvensicola TaxID=29529 RepID=A0A1I0PMD3_9BACT|nr:hypothetical protein [Chitinophaga arvensicola]SEW15577.1 hypothetical protein SAMN04488122_0869 [Chitinophaga arvensicola]